MMRRLLLPALAILTVSACSERDGAPADTVAAPDAQSAAPLPPADPAVSATIGGDGSPLELAALSPEDVEGLEGELACSFTPEVADGRAHLPILVARGNVAPEERSFALIKIGETVEIFSSRTEGGYDAMVDGTGYGGRGLTLEIARTGADSTPGQEGLSFPATLSADRADGARRSWDGVWSCGP